MPKSVSKPRSPSRRASVAGRLIEDAVARKRGGEGGCVGVLLDLEGVKAGANEKKELVAQHLAGGAQLAAKAMLLAQEARLAVGAAVAEAWKDQRHQREAVEMRGELGDLAVVRPQHADRRLAAGDVRHVGKESRRRDDHGHAIRD